jgi:hypothetical protein
MALVKVPLSSGEDVTIEVDQGDVPDDLALASPYPGQLTARMAASLEDGLDTLKPALEAIVDRLAAARPQEFSVEFGIRVGGEVGVYIAKGTTEVNFLVTMKWVSPDSGHQARKPSEGNP